MEHRSNLLQNEGLVYLKTYKIMSIKYNDAIITTSFTKVVNHVVNFEAEYEKRQMAVPDFFAKLSAFLIDAYRSL